MECINCGRELNHQELDIWFDSPRCCNGYMCGCMGEPVDPPYCRECMGDEYYKPLRHKSHMNRLGKGSKRRKRLWHKLWEKEPILWGIKR